jgi:hypothetical protein
VVDPMGFDGHSAKESIKIINAELKKYSPALAKKPQMILVNKQDLTGADKIFKEINSLKERVDTDRERALDEIEKSKNLVHYGFIALLFVTVFGIAGLCFSYFEYVSEGPIVESYKKDFKEDISGGRAEIENLKTESDSLRKQIRSCSHEVSFWNYRQCLGNM